MSSLHVRQFAREQMSKLKTPFFETINTDIVVPDQDLWMTLSFNSYMSQKQTFCNDFMETGVISLIFFGTAGQGDEILLAQAEQDALVFYSQQDPSGLLTLVSCSPPEEASSADGRPLYVVTMAVTYQFNQSFRG